MTEGLSLGPEYKELTKDELEDMLGDPEATPEAPTEGTPTGTETPAEPAPTPAEQAVQPPVEGTPAEPVEPAPPVEDSKTQKLLEQYKTPEDLAKALEHAQSLIGRKEAERRALQEQLLQTQAEQQFVPPVSPAPDFEAMGLDEDTARGIQAAIDQRVNQGLAQRQAAEAERQTRRQALGSLSEFREAHPDADEAAVSSVFEELNVYEDGKLVRSDGQIFEDALEVSRDPNLQNVLKVNPNLWDSPEGMAVARAQAQMLQGSVTPVAPVPAAPAAQAPAQPVTPSATPQAPKPATPVVETGNSGPPAPPKPTDEVDEIEAYIKGQNKSGFGF